MWKRGEKESTEKVLEKEGFLSWSLYSPLNGWIIQEGGWVKSCLGVWPEEEEMKKIIRLAWMRLVPLNFSLKVENSFLLSLHLSLSNYHSPINNNIWGLLDWRLNWRRTDILIQDDRINFNSKRRGRVKSLSSLLKMYFKYLFKKMYFPVSSKYISKSCPSPPLASISSSLLS